MPETDLDFSIVVPVHNEERHLEGCIDALLGLDYPADRFEIIMVDNNSTDRSVEIIRRYPRLRLFEETRQGDFAARNRGIAESTGAIIAFTDSDTAPSGSWLTSIAAVMGDPGIQIVVGRIRFASESRLMSMLAEYEAQKNEHIFSSGIKELYYGYTCNMAVRRTVFDRGGLFPEVYRSSDVMLVQRVVDEHCTDAVSYGPEVDVRRLEISTFREYLQKLNTHGRDFRRYGKLASVRALTVSERLRLFRSAARSAGCSLPAAARFFVSLACGAVAYELGRLQGPGSSTAAAPLPASQ